MNIQNFSGWTTNNVLDSKIVLQWLLRGMEKDYQYRMQTIGYTPEQLNYDWRAWKKAWKSMQLTNGDVWTGVPPQITNDIPALYQKTLPKTLRNFQQMIANRNDNILMTNIVKFDLLCSGDVFEWADIISTTPIQKIVLEINSHDKIVEENINARQIRFAPFIGGVPKYLLPYTQFVLSVYLSSPGTVETKVYSTIIPISLQDELRERRLFVKTRSPSLPILLIDKSVIGKPIKADLETLCIPSSLEGSCEPLATLQN